jgi:5-methylthioadenosine/S-adenosylhomocysteine deaminase
MSALPPLDADLLIRARWVVPVEPAGVVLHDHAVVVEAGRIVAVMPAAAALERYRPRRQLERSGHVLLPGLVNAHTHAAMTLLRGLADDLPLDRWLTEHIWPAEGRWVSPEFVRDGGRLALLEMLRGGTTCFVDMYMFPDAMAALAVEHHQRAALGMIVLEAPTAWARTPDEYIARGLAVHDQYRQHPLVTTTFAPHAPYSVGDAALARVRRLAAELEVPVHMHVHETAAEVDGGLTRDGRRPLARLDDLGLLAARFMAVHATQLTADEIALLGARSASVVHCPSSNLKLASGAAPVADLLDAGVNVALGTDGAASNNRLDLFQEMRLAALLSKLERGDAASLPATTALQMATLNGARALGLEDEIGSLLPGKQADCICVNLQEAATQPVHNVISQLVYAANSHQVSDVWIGGEHLLDRGQPVRLDAAEIMARAAGWAERLAPA